LKLTRCNAASYDETSWTPTVVGFLNISILNVIIEQSEQWSELQFIHVHLNLNKNLRSKEFHCLMPYHMYDIFGSKSQWTRWPNLHHLWGQEKIKGNHLGGGPVVRAWDQEICFLCGFRFEPCGCSYDSHWRLTWSLTSEPVGLVEMRAGWPGHPR